MPDIKPIRYNLLIYFGSFDDDSAGFESSTPFIPLNVGDYIDHRLSKDIMVPSEEPEEGERWQVAAVKHSFQDLGSHISQYVHVCIERKTQNDRVQPR